VSTALYHRERSGRGQKLDVALLQAALVLQNNHINHIDAIDDWRGGFVDYLKTAFAEGKTWTEVLAHRAAIQPHAFAKAYYGFFPTRDGTIAIAAAGRVNQLRILRVLGLKDRWVEEPGWLPDDPATHMERSYAQVVDVLRSQPTAHWVTVLTAAGVPAAPVRLREELLDDEQVWANQFLVRREHDLIGGLTTVAPPVKFSATPLTAGGASPPLGRDSRSILVEAGLDAETIERLIADGTVGAGAL